MTEDDLTEALTGVDRQNYGNNFQPHLLEQYKLYVSLADKISERRQFANTFFLTINSALIAGFGITLPGRLGPNSAWSLFLTIVGLLLCMSWFMLLRSYRNLNTGKFKVIHAIEQNLPLRLYDAEWRLLGKGKKPKSYRPLTHIETITPLLFLTIYVGIAIIAMAKSATEPATPCATFETSSSASQMR